MSPMAPAAPTRPALPAALRWGSLAWLLLWAPAYWKYWGAANFLHLSDISVVLSCLGFFFESPLLITSQAVACPVADAVWTADFLWHLIFHHPLLGGTEYMFDANYPLWVRLLSLFHIVLPLLLLWAVRRTSYDRRGWILQSAIALPVFIASRFINPALNMNFAFTDPFLHRQWGPAPLHVLVAFAFMVVVVYLPTDFLLAGLLTRRDTAAPSTK
jgi:hypothetical protein